MKGLQKAWYVIILIFILPNVLFAQTNVNVGWSRVQGLGGGDVETLTQKGDTLFVFTKSAIYASLDDGDTWSSVREFLSASRTLVANSGSIAIFKEPVRVEPGVECEDTLFDNNRILFF